MENINLDEKLNKLPKWTQEYISTLRWRIEVVEKANRLLKKENMPSKIYYDTSLKFEKKIYIPEEYTINFVVNDFILNVGIYNNEINIFGGSPINIVPASSNYIKIEGRK